MTIPSAPSHEFKGIKDALVHAGLLDAAKAGRGRPSRQMLTDAEMLVRDHNYRISGYATKPAAKDSTPTSTPAPAKVEKVARTSGKEIADLMPQMRGDDVVPYADGKPWKMGIRGICTNCNVSLTHCPCPQPMVRLDFQTIVPVEFRAKKGV